MASEVHTRCWRCEQRVHVALDESGDQVHGVIERVVDIGAKHARGGDPGRDAEEIDESCRRALDYGQARHREWVVVLEIDLEKCEGCDH